VLSSLATALARRIWPLIGLAALGIIVIWALGTRRQPHHVTVAFPSAVGLFSGLDVKEYGVEVGKVSSVRAQDGQAIVVLGLDNGRAWPLRQGTKAVIRFGSTIGNGTRYVQLLPGPRSAPAIRSGGILQPGSGIPAVEFDQLFNTFGGATRTAGQELARRGAATLHADAPRQFSAGIAAAPSGLGGLDGVFEDLDADRAVLRALVPSARTVTGTLNERAPEVSDLVLVASQTFQTFADNSGAIRAALERLPGSLGQLRTTMNRLTTASSATAALLRDVSPGVAPLNRLAVVLRPTLAALRQTTGIALSTINRAVAVAPPVQSLFARLSPTFQQHLEPTLQSANPMLECIAPYAPELAGAVANWASWSQYQYAAAGPGSIRFGRYHLLTGPASATGVPEFTLQDAARLPGIQVASARPPGLAAGQPRYISRCGYRTDSPSAKATP
jgi:ABC-type transporter Mla subunit MlaD